MSDSKPLVGIIMGSKSDWDAMRAAGEMLTKFGVAHESRVMSAHREPDVVDADDLHLAPHGDTPGPGSERARSRAARHALSSGLEDSKLREGEPMGFLDKVKEKTQEALVQAKDVAQTQQLKLQLKKLESEEEETLAAFGNAAFGLWEAGSLSTIPPPVPPVTFTVLCSICE